MQAIFSDPADPNPMRLPDGTVVRGLVHLARVIDHPNITVGAFTYANTFDPPDDWAARLAPYLYPGAPERLVIGRFCAIAHGAQFITASANHAMGGVSTYPFSIFDPAMFPVFRDTRGSMPETVIGHDVWIGDGAVILPGVRVGHGAIIGARAVVARDVPDYAVVAGNPARVVRMRFEAETVARLLRLSWWDWPEARIAAARPMLMAGDLAALEA